MKRGFKISQRNKILKLLKQYKMENCKVAATPMNVEYEKENITGPECDIDLYRSLIGSLLYLSRWSRPDISIAVNLLSRNVCKPNEKHWQSAKRVLRYLKNKQLYLEPKGELTIIAYADANYGSDIITRRSTSGMTVHLGGSLVNWKTARQKFISLSSAESEYAALSELCIDLVYYKQLAQDLGIFLQDPITVNENNQAAIQMANSPNVKSKSKHTDIRYQNVKQNIENGLIELIYCETEKNIADCLTKALGPTKHERACNMLGLK